MKWRVRSTTEVLAALNATRKKVAPNSLGLCRLQHSDESGQLLQVDLPGKGEESHIVPKATASRERFIDGVCEVFECDESQSNSPVREGKSDCRRRRFRANMHAFCQGNIEHVFNANRDPGERIPRKEVASEGGGVSAIPPIISVFTTWLILPEVTYLSHSLPSALVT